ncbi:hypothetical protein OG921_26160 [Aldersonia sp. NBC_00410]|uniref:hypothetical protein n=1 Tax=Aldersonia sp. NBC_00410 TaxID=2975954 RepID=UPI0022596939|nr:hypothetical protein [Aldersonia sp. NBC_00410]MCX5046663.1 hypothetical protein [Aldersonia sp. NBC_00410]
MTYESLLEKSVYQGEVMSNRVNVRRVVGGLIAATFVIAGSGFAAGTAAAEGAAEGARDTASLEQAEQNLNEKHRTSLEQAEQNLNKEHRTPLDGSGNGPRAISPSGNGIPNGPGPDGAQAHSRG